MKARLIFYCAALVALVLILAAVPSHATERRDPLIMQDAQQGQGAKLPPSVHGTASSKKQASASKKSSRPNVNPLSQAKDKSAAKKDSLGSGKGTGTASSGIGGSAAAK